MFVYRDDLAISIVMGRRHLEHYQEDWATNFADRTPRSGWIDFLYSGNLVYSDIYVAVDGGRCGLPSFSDTNKKVSRRYNNILRLLQHISGGAGYNYDDYFARTGAVLTDEAWPRFRDGW
ncbi:MAG: hypothetical protein ACU0DH_15695 [Paracoccus sp. (in: a-proteobacteria)]|uniref:hypothetical protein n=1 Tax=Paracoccus sp. TaxID=267 RepID=UPI004059F9BA